MVALNQTTHHECINISPNFLVSTLPMLQCPAQESRPIGPRALRGSVVDSGILNEHQIYYDSEYLLRTFTMKWRHLRSCEVLPTWYLPSTQQKRDDPFSLSSRFIPWSQRVCAAQSQLYAFLPNVQRPTFWSLGFWSVGSIFVPWKCATSQASSRAGC